MSDQTAATHLAFIGSIKDEVTDKNELAFLLIQELIKINPDIVAHKYNIDLSDDIEQVMADIARKKGCLSKGNCVDIDRACVAIIDDFRKGRIGKICLDKGELL